MELLISVLNDMNHVEEVIKSFNEVGIHGATIIDSTGMAEILSTIEEEIPMFGSLKMFLNKGRHANKTIFTVLKHEQVDVAIDTIKDVVGDLSKPGVGIVFTIPVNRIEGVSL